MREKILAYLEKHARIDLHDLAILLDADEAVVANTIADMEKENIICGYHTLINWDMTSEEKVTALIEVKVTPQSLAGFDRIAERIYQYDEVESMYLMSGSFDLTVIISGRSLREVAQFVGERLAPLEGVTGTATHFILKKYKEKHLIFRPQEPQEREYIFV